MLAHMADRRAFAAVLLILWLMITRPEINP